MEKATVKLYVEMGDVESINRGAKVRGFIKQEDVEKPVEVNIPLNWIDGTQWSNDGMGKRDSLIIKPE